MFLLGYAKDPGFRPDYVTAETYGDLWPAMAHSLVASVERALDAGAAAGLPNRAGSPDSPFAVASRSRSRFAGGPGTSCRSRLGTTSSAPTSPRTASCWPRST